MALTKDELTVGQQVYKLNIVNDSFRREKLRFVDAEGNEWYRYDRPRWTYDVVLYKITGIAQTTIIGEVSNDEPYDTWYHLKNERNTFIVYTADELMEDLEVPYAGNFYSSEKDAIKKGEDLCRLKNAE